MNYEMKENETFVVMEDGERDLRERTKAFALRIIKLFVALPKRAEAQVLGKQVLRSGTSVRESSGLTPVESVRLDPPETQPRPIFVTCRT